MEKKIIVSDIEAPALIEFYTNRITAMEAQVNAYKKTLGVLIGNEASSAQNMQRENGHIVHADGYNNNWTWLKKIEHILELSELTTSQIVNEIIRYEPEKVSERSKVVASVSAVLSSKSKHGGVFGKRINERNENIYYINEINNNGEKSDDDLI